MVRQKLGAFSRMKRKRAEKISENKKEVEKIGAFERIKRKRDAKLAEKKKKVAEVAAPVKEARKELVVAREVAAVAEKKAETAAAKGAKLVSPAKVKKLKAEAEVKVAAVKRLEKVAPPEPPSQLSVALNVFDWALIIFAVGADLLKINKWYAVGAAALFAGLFYLADKQGWLGFLNL